MTNRELTLTIAEAREVLQQIAGMYDVAVDDIRGRRRSRPLPEARAVFAITMRDRGYSLSEIGYALFVHHTSVLSMLANAATRARYVAEGMRRDRQARANDSRALESPGIVASEHAEGGMLRQGAAA